MHLKKYLVLCLSFILISSSSLYAKAFYITPLNINCSSLSGAALQTACNDFNSFSTQMTNDLTNDVEPLFADAGQHDFAKFMGEAGLASSKGLGVDYASNISHFVVGAGVGAGVTGISALSSGFDMSEPRMPQIGAGANVTAMAGVNASLLRIPDFGPIKANRLNIYVNGFGINLSNLVKDSTMKMFNIGVYFQYKLIDQKKILPAKMLHWGGIDIGTGFNHTSQTISIHKTFSKSHTESVGTATVSFDGNIGIENSIESIPFEISTNLQMLYIMTMFLGVGGDVNFGSGTLLAAMNGSVSLADSNGTNFTGAGAGINLSAKENLQLYNARAFGGLQFNITLVKVVVQASISTPEGIGLGVAARVAY